MAENFFFRSPDPIVRDNIAEHKTKFSPAYREVQVRIAVADNLLFPPQTDIIGGQGALNSSDTIQLKGLQIKLDGDYGTLRRLKVEFLFPNFESFETYEDRLGIGRDIAVSYGYADSKLAGPFNFRIYNPSFKILSNGRVELTVEAVGAGNELLESNIISTFNVTKQNLKFVADYNGYLGNDIFPVVTLADYIDWLIQGITSQSNTVLFDPIDQAYTAGPLPGKTTRKGFVIISIDDDVYKNKYIAYQDSIWNDEYKLVYISMGMLVDVINAVVRPTENSPVKTFELVSDGTSHMRGELQYTTNGGENIYIPSADPLTLLMTYGRNTLDYARYETSTTRETDEFGIEGPEQENTKSIGTAFEPSKIPNISFFDLSDGDLNGILINRDAIKAALYDTEMNADTADTKQDASKISLDRFFERIFKIIRENTGGAVDLVLQSDPENNDIEKARILIINRKSPVDNAVTPVQFNIGDYVTKEISLQSYVPKELQATIFGAAPGSSEYGTATGQALSDNAPPLPKQPSLLDISSAAGRIGATNFDADALAAMRDLLKRVVGDRSPAEVAKYGPMLLPLTLTLKLHGTEGFRFGDTVYTNLLPKKYRMPSINNPDARVAFTVLRITHTFSGTGQILWETELETACRLVESAKLNIQNA